MEKYKEYLYGDKQNGTYRFRIGINPDEAKVMDVRWDRDNKMLCNIIDTPIPYIGQFSHKTFNWLKNLIILNYPKA